METGINSERLLNDMRIEPASSRIILDSLAKARARALAVDRSAPCPGVEMLTPDGQSGVELFICGDAEIDLAQWKSELTGTGYYGVFAQVNGGYSAQLESNQIQKCNGVYSTAQEAARVVAKEFLELHGAPPPLASRMQQPKQPSPDAVVHQLDSAHACVTRLEGSKHGQVSLQVGTGAVGLRIEQRAGIVHIGEVVSSNARDAGAVKGMQLLSVAGHSVQTNTGVAQLLSTCSRPVIIELYDASIEADSMAQMQQHEIGSIVDDSAGSDSAASEKCSICLETPEKKVMTSCRHGPYCKM